MIAPRAAALALVPLVGVLAACDAPGLGPGSEEPGLGLALPIGGVVNQDWYLTNYADQVEGAGIGDHRCGAKAYDGHQGVDLVLPDFAAMDEGVAVVAAAPGTVTFVHDGEFDRHKSWESGAFWNAVYIDHGDGYVAWYGHLMRNSIRVEVGQTVQAGDTLGLVGSSGRSDMPHLHFELRHGGAWVDPFRGDCGPATDQWADPLPYQDEFRLIQAGLTLDPLDLDRVKDPPTPAETVTMGPGTLHAWVHYHNVRTGSRSRWVVRRPDGSVHRDFGGTHGSFHSMSWWWYMTSLDDFDTPGVWTVEFHNDGRLLTTRTFQLDAAAGDAGDDAVAGRSAGAVVEAMDGGALR